ncbi:arginine--tRNA ligase [bacterium]|nr:arginine--tRNA ligase [bacterium]
MNVYKKISDDIRSKIAAIPELSDKISPEILQNIAIEVPKIRDFGDYSTNIAMVLARPLHMSPRDVAAIVLPVISALPYVADASIAGPGFINIRLHDEFIIDAAANCATPDVPSSPRMIDLDYGGYNIGKSLHVGHLRTTIVGDTFNRIARHLGHRVRSYNHMGDWGRPMGLIIAWILENGMPETADEINRMYPMSSERAKNDAEWMTRAKDITAKLQSGDPEYRRIYDVFSKISLDQIDALLGRLNILPFDENKGERLIADFVPEMQDILIAKNLLKTDDGAQIIPVRTDDDNAPMPPVMWRSSAGAQTYAAADLTAVHYRIKNDNPTDIIYFTDNRQALHFTQIFRAARLCGYGDVNLQHIGFGTITGPDGKPFKTRDGNVPSLNDMIDMVAASVRARVADAGKELPTATIEQIAMAALKFNDLMHDVRSDYIFDPDSVTRFEGRTGPYILYTAVRLNSILRKCGEMAPAATMELSADERNLVLTMLDFGRVLDTAFARRATDLLANYAYDLAQAINTFYHNCPILRDDVDDATRAHRVAIVAMAARVLGTAIDLMGMQVPESM